MPELADSGPLIIEVGLLADMPKGSEDMFSLENLPVLIPRWF